MTSLGWLWGRWAGPTLSEDETSQAGVDHDAATIKKGKYVADVLLPLDY